MLRRSIIKSIIAVLALFVLSFASLAVITKSYAVELFDAVFNGKMNSADKDIEFDAYFKNAEKEKSYSAISGVCKKYNSQQNLTSNETENIVSKNVENVNTDQNIDKKNVIDTGQKEKLDTGQYENIDTGQKKFDLQLSNSISKITIENRLRKTDFNCDNLSLAKVSIQEKYFNSSIVYIEYILTVTNKGDVPGYAKKIVDYIPKGLEFNPNLNSDWYRDSDGNIYSEELSNKILKKGESKSLKLILTKKLNIEDDRLVKNTAEIVEDYNDYGLEDINSKPGNKLKKENDFSSADVEFTVKSGGGFIVTSVLLTTIMLGGIAVFIIISKLSIRKRKEGGV